MLVSCRYCSAFHKRGETCINRPKHNSYKKETNAITRFRSSRLWQKKRQEIKQRDKFLCQHCKKNGLYQFNKLEVHHMIPISKAWNKRLKNNNLITLCSACHKKADNNEIPFQELKEIVDQTFMKTPFNPERPQNDLY
jgi:5-methylcytosine-specific restriction endonuclease McrA